MAYGTSEGPAELQRQVVQHAGRSGLLRRQFDDADASRERLVGLTRTVSDKRGQWLRSRHTPAP